MWEELWEGIVVIEEVVGVEYTLINQGSQ